MKKYIVPTAKAINVVAENLIAMSLQTGLSNPANQLSNKAEEMEWDDDEE